MIEEPISVLWPRHRTALVLTEDAVAVSSHQVVHRAQHPVREYGERSRGPPGPSERRHHEQHRPPLCEVARRPAPVVRDHMEGVQIMRVASEAIEYRRGHGALKGSEVKLTPPVPREDGLDEAVAESADAVVEEQMPAACRWRPLHVDTRHG